uniref:Nucleoporin p58/p45 n=1 Tax=Globodera rostochiensis TaxID=31243 RepID=A0A914HUA3_GLORO
MSSATESLNLDVAEVPDVLSAQLVVLIKALNENMRLYTECKEIKIGEELKNLEEKAAKVFLSINSHKSLVKRERMRVAETAKKIGLDQRIAHSIQRTRDNLARNPQFGRVHSVDFLHEVAAQNEQALVEQWETVGKLRQILDRLRKSDEEPSLSQHDLADHLNRFDGIFEQVATQVYAVSDSAEKLRDVYLEQRRKLGGHFALIDPFEKHKERQRLIDAYSALKGIDAFPSSNALLQLGEYLPKQPTVPAQSQFGMTQFGQPPGGGGLPFGASKPPAFSFTPSAQQSSTNIFGVQKPTFGGMQSTTNAAATATIPFGTSTTTLPTSTVSGGTSLFATHSIRQAAEHFSKARRRQNQPVFSGVNEGVKCRSIPAQMHQKFDMGTAFWVYEHLFAIS